MVAAELPASRLESVARRCESVVEQRARPLPFVKGDGLDLNLIDDRQRILIGYHGGCPDGAAAAYMLSATLRKLHPSTRITIVPIGHRMQKFASAIEPGMLVFSLDVTPSMEDLEALRRADAVIILDHHVSEEEIQLNLARACANVINLSDNSGTQCATSMVSELTRGICDFDQDIVSMVHKMDVFAFELPCRLEDDFLGFKSYLVKRGERNVQMDLVEEMFANSARCISEGRELQTAMIRRTDELAGSLETVAETRGWRVLVATQAAHCRPVDFMHYQKRIDEQRIDNKRTLVLTRDLEPLPGGLFNLGLRRAGGNLDLSVVAAKFKLETGVVSASGHPFAGGVQSHNLFAREAVVEIAMCVMDSTP